MQLEMGMFMKELYDSMKTLILDNYSLELSDTTLDILTVASMALFVKNGELTMKRLPKILSKIEIVFGDKPAAELISDRFPEYPRNDITDSHSAMVLRAIEITDEGKLDEDWAMFISTCSIEQDLIKVIAGSIHEFTHLLRFNGISETEKEGKVRDGISVSYFNKETKNMKRKHFNIEEGIVENYTSDTMQEFYDFIKDEDVSFSLSLSCFQRDYERKYEPGYTIQRLYLDRLSKDSEFKRLVDCSFVDEKEPPELIEYFNRKLSDPSAFTSFSKNLDKLVECAYNDDLDNCEQLSKKLIMQANNFLSGKRY